MHVSYSTLLMTDVNGLTFEDAALSFSFFTLSLMGVFIEFKGANSLL